MLRNLEKAHFIGIGGIGMSSLAHILLSKGIKVSGSDLQESVITKQLEKKGATIFIGHNQFNLDHPNIVIVSTAIDSDNPELKKAQSNGILIWHRADLLNELLKSHKSIAVTGTHGKTTTTAMTSLVLKNASLDPTIIIGGIVPEFNSNAVTGSSEYLVAEVDESDQSIRNLTSNIAIITNIEEDHLEHYKDINEIVEAILEFSQNMPIDGKVIIGIDTIASFDFISKCKKDIITFSINKPAMYQATNIELLPKGSNFEVLYKNQFFGKFSLKVPGIHNISNALATIACSSLLNIPNKIIYKTLVNFKGVNRRFHLIGEVNNISIYDDYAHHPTEIRAVLKIVKMQKRHNTVIFEPHRYSRTKALLKNFSKSFDDAERLIITDIFPASESSDIYDNISSAHLFELLKKNYPKKEIFYIPDSDDIIKFLIPRLRDDELIITIGAGKINKLAKNILNSLKSLNSERSLID